MNLVIPDPALVVLVGPSGSGKTTFARAHFRSAQIVSSDALREMLSDSAADQGASIEAFRLLSILVNGRLKRRLTTVVDATNLRVDNRGGFRRLAMRNGVPTFAIAFDLPLHVYAARNALRPGRIVDDGVVGDQTEKMAQALAALPDEGYDGLYVLGEADTADSIEIKRPGG